ncbi:MAG: PIG-L family deacetylase [Candidatus Heimdallarchaeota archaeon]|nr:PIG-L family deacetylase [Candidatus Heimdallarchaeota archaeon]
MMNDKYQPLNVVAVFAHPDDEAGAVGTLMNHSDRGDNVYVIMLTHGENASSLIGSHDEITLIRQGHVNQIEKIIGAQYRLMNLPDSGVFPSVENAKHVARIFKQLKPDIIITWGKSKTMGVGHPDHRYTHDIVLDAISYARYNEDNNTLEPHRKPISLYTPNLGDDPNTQNCVYVDVTEQHDRIMEFFNVYEEAYGEWPVRAYKLAGMLMTGRMAYVKYAESFQKINWRTARKYLD